ncbi:DUF1194 domain-containing protein [Thalassotalea ganghwensis]
MLKNLSKSLLCCAALFTASANANLIEVDLELQLLADVSYSVDAKEYALQLQGYSNAFRDANVISAIESGTIGSIAVQYIEWSGSADQAIQLDWTLIDSQASAYAFADALDALTRAFDNNTAPGSALNFGSSLFFNNDYDAARQVIDVSGDGNQNQGSSTSAARDAALAAGIDTINGITIGDASGLQDFYKQNIIGGTNAFHIHADSFADFTAGISQKLVREITGGGSEIPEPSSVALFGLALLGFASASRKKA